METTTINENIPAAQHDDLPTTQLHEEPLTQATPIADVVNNEVQRLGLALHVSKRVLQLLEQIGATSVTPQQAALMAHAVNRDEELHNADTTGYLRGRNEQIEATQHFPALPDNDAPTNDEQNPPTFPIYNRRSVWNC